MSTKHERRTIYLTKRWRVLRQKVLTRDGGLCVRCRAERSTGTAACASGAARKAERLTEQIKSAVAFVAVDTGVNLLGLAADDPRFAYVHRAGRGCRPRVLRWIGPGAALLVRSLRRIV